MSLKNLVLVLNQSFEPIQTMSIEDAFINYFNGKVYIEEYAEKVYHSAHQEHPVPSVIRLKNYVPINKRRRDTATKRTRIYMRDSHKCAYCGEKGNYKELTLDHIIPKCKKGEYSEEIINSPDNLVTCCFKCNQRKRNHSLEESGMELRYSPKHLKIGLDKVTIQYWAEQRPSWGKYLFVSHEGDETHYDN